MPVIQSKCFKDTFWVLLKAHFTREHIVCCAQVGGLKICHLLSLIESDLAHLICQQNWQFASLLDHLTAEVDSFHLLCRSGWT